MKKEENKLSKLSIKDTLEDNMWNISLIFIGFISGTTVGSYGIFKNFSVANLIVGAIILILLFHISLFIFREHAWSNLLYGRAYDDAVSRLKRVKYLLKKYNLSIPEEETTIPTQNR